MENTHREILQPFFIAFETFKANLTTETSAAQEANRQQNTALTSKINNLESRLADAEAEHDQLKSDLALSKEEAVRWKGHYEGLKKAMQDTMKRRF